jgi:hypothetical protein
MVSLIGFQFSSELMPLTFQLVTLSQTNIFLENVSIKYLNLFESVLDWMDCAWCCEAQAEISAWLDSSWSAQPEISSCGSPSIRSYYQNLLLFVRCLEFDFSSVPSGACTRSACTVSSGAVSLCLICLILCSFRFFLVVLSRSLVFARACC